MPSPIGGADVPLVRNSSSVLTKESAVAPLEHRPFYRLLVGSLALGLAMLCTSLIGLSVWGQALYFHDPGPYAQNSWCGYDKRTFVGLFFFTAFPTVGFTLVYVALSTMMRCTKSTLHILLYLFFASVCLNVGSAGMVWGGETMKCLGVFCVNMEKYVEIPYARPEAGIGFLSIVGIAAFGALVPVGIAMLVLGSRTLLHRARFGVFGDGDSTAAYPAHAAMAPPAEDETTSTIVAGFFLWVLVGAFGFTTLYIPNSWEYFVAARIAKNAALLITTNATICNTYFNQYTCSELPWAYMSTANWQVSENLVLKSYPSNIIFYVYLLLIIAFVVIVRSNRHGRLFVKRHVGRTGLTVGELSLAVLTIAMLVLFFVYWVHDHNYNGYWQGGDNPSITPAERWARSTGQLAVIFMSLLFFPASRNSVVHKIFGTSWEASLWAHRALGYGMLAATFSHMVAWYKFYDMGGFFPRDIFDVPMMLPTSIDNFTVPLSTLAAWLLFVCMGVLAYEPIRRKSFEVFYYSHLVAAYFAIPVVLWHAAAGWEYLIPGLTVWFVDRVTRFLRSSSPVQLVDAKNYRDVTELRFLVPTMSAAPGQYVFINIPEIALYEWHPFTLSTGAHSAEFTLHIKSMGQGTWTQRLHKIVESGSHDITLGVDGPYGQPFPATEFRKVILVAGGIGITPCASIFSFLKHQDDVSVTLIWSLREEEVAAAFTQHLATMRRNSGNAINGSLPSDMSSFASNAKVFLTRTNRSTGTATVLSELSGVDVFSARPNMESEIQAAAVGYEPADVAVFVCGPEVMVVDALKVATDCKFHFHRETFLL